MNSKLRNSLRIFVPFVFIPLLMIYGSFAFEKKRYLIISFAVIFLSFALFSLGFERRCVGTRRMVITSIMTALSFIGRFIPIIKPVSAVIIISALYLGGEAGFLIGALTAFLTNFYFGQGPWTPFQMFAWGIGGFLAGVLSKPLLKHKILLILYGVISAVMYSFTMDIWTVLCYSDYFDINLYLAALVSGIRHTAVYIISNVIYLILLSGPIGEKLQRIKIKYGI